MEGAKEKVIAYLTQIYGETTNRKFKLLRSKVTIGRGYRADIRLLSPNISRNHCTLNCTKAGWTITDNGSQNGTYISGRKLKPNESRLLQCGDIIFLGPPSEMPEAFCFDDAFVEEDEEITESGYKIIELLPVKCPVEEQKSVSKKCLIDENTAVASLSIKDKCVIETADPSQYSQSKKIVSASDYKSNISNKEEAFNSNDDICITIESQIDLELSPKLNEAATQGSTSCILHEKPSFESPPSKQLKLDDSDSGYQIHEISSTGIDKAEDSLSLLDIEENEVVKPSTSGYKETKNNPKCLEDSSSPKEIDILKSKLALMSEQIKKLEQVKLDILKNYEIVCEKNFSLDQQLAEKKKLEEELKSCELKAKDNLKNEILEKFEEDLICNICTELLIKPTVLDCSHSFCLHCIKEWKKKKNECPICRRKISTMTPVLTLEHFIDKALSTLTPGQKEKRNQLIAERENPPKKTVTPTSKRYGRSRRRFRRSHTSVNHLNSRTNRSDVEIIGERRSNILPIPLAPLASIPRMYLTIPELFLDNDRDSFSVVIT